MTSRFPLITIIIPNYNCAEFLADAVESVYKQTNELWELIIIDDASTDGSREILSRYSSDPKIRLIFKDRNEGVSSARNDGIDRARGDFVAFLDSDDVWHPQKLDVQLRFMKDRNLDFSGTHYRWMSEGGKPLIPAAVGPEKISYRILLRHNFLGCSTLMAKKSVFKKARFRQVHNEDYALWLELLKLGFSCGFLPETLVYYRNRSGSRSKGRVKNLRSYWRIYREVLGLRPAKSFFAVARFYLEAIKQKAMRPSK